MAGALTTAPPGSMVIDLGKRKKADLKPDSGLDWMGYNRAPHDGPDKDRLGRWKSGHPSIRALGDMPDFAHHLHDDDLKQAKLQAKSLIQAIEAEEKRRAPAKPLRAAKVKAPVKAIPADLAERVEAMKKRPIPSDLAYLEEELPKLTVAQLEQIGQYGDFEGTKLSGDKKLKTLELMRRLTGKLQSEAVTHRAEHKVELDAEFRRRAALADVTGNREEYGALVSGFGVAGTGPGLPPERTVESPESRRINELTELIGKTKPGAEKKALQAERRALGEKIMTGKPVPPKQDFGVGSDPWAPSEKSRPRITGLGKRDSAEARTEDRRNQTAHVEELRSNLVAQYGEDPDNWPEARQDREVEAFYDAEEKLRKMRRGLVEPSKPSPADKPVPPKQDFSVASDPWAPDATAARGAPNPAKPLRAKKVTPVTEDNDLGALKTKWSNGTFAMDIDAIIANPQANSPALLTEMLKRLKVAELGDVARKHNVKLLGRTKAEKIDSFVASTVQNKLNSQAIRGSVDGTLKEALEPNHGTVKLSPADDLTRRIGETSAKPSGQATHLNTPARTVGNGMFFGNQYHGDGNMGQAIRDMTDEQRAININGDRLDDALADVIIMGHSGEAGVSARQVEAWKRIATQVEGVDMGAARKIREALAKISAPSGTQGRSMLEGMGAPEPLQKLMGIIEGAAANKATPDAEAKRLLDIAENYLSGKESALGMINRVRDLRTGRHESQEGFFEIRNAAAQAADELDAMFKAKTLPMRNRRG